MAPVINDTELFEGLDAIDWAAMSHAYGPAVEVPELLRGLVADDPAVRETALDRMYMGVHHQGDVYDSTLAAIPFLLDAAARPALPGRAEIVALLASIGGVEHDEDDDEFDTDGEDEDDEFDTDAEDEDDHEPDDDVDVEAYRRAREAVGEARALFLVLLEDPDPAVRAAAPSALLVRPDAELATVLSARLPGESDPEARAALLGALGRLNRRALAGRLPGADPAPLLAALRDTVAAPGPASQRLTALVELAGSAPDALGPEAVPTTLELLDQLYAERNPAPQPGGFRTDTRTGALRELREQESAGRPSPEAAGLVHQVSRALGERVGERTSLLTTLLRAGDWFRRYDAISPAQVLIEGWRGAYDDLVFLLGEQLLDPHPRLAAAAARSLHHLDVLAAPAADAMARALHAAPRTAPHDRAGPPPWVIRWSQGLPSLGPVPHALAALGDERVLPTLAWTLEQREPAGDVGQALIRMGPAAAGLVPLIGARLTDRRKEYGDLRSSLAFALARVGAPAASCVPQLVGMLPDAGAVRALGALGPAAADAGAGLRALLGSDDRSTALSAASALWRIEGDPVPLLPVLRRFLDGDPHEARAAAEVIADLGPAAEETAPRLRQLVTADDPYGWLPLDAAVALWRVARDHTVALPVLMRIWAANPYTRRAVARHLVEFGPLAADAAPLLGAELGRVRRHNSRDGMGSTDQVAADEELLRHCRAALAALG